VNEVGRAAGAEWAGLVTAAVLGTDRRPLPAPGAGWDVPARSDDPAIQLLDRAAAVATARRAGRRPAPAPPLVPPLELDPRPVCPPTAAAALARMLSGQFDLLVGEWFALCEAGGFQLPAHLLPALLMRGRKQPALDIAVRRIAGARARWLAEAMPELRLAPEPARLPAGTEPLLAPPRPPDSGALVSAVIDTFADRSATWALAGQMRLVVAAIDPVWLPTLIRDLNRAPFHAVTERTRVDLLGLAQLRSEMIVSMSAPKSADAVPLPRG
jgi:hypothetical protein